MNIVNLEVRDLPAAWFETLFKILEEGTVFTIDEGSYAGQKRLEFDYITIKINYPGTNPVLPQIEAHYGIPNPVEDNYIYGGEGYDRSYIEYLMTGRKEPGESYTYGERLSKANLFDYTRDLCIRRTVKEMEEIYYHDENKFWGDEKIITRDSEDPGFDEVPFFFLNQIELAIWTYKNKGHRNNQIVLQVAQPADMVLKDPPCLRHIDTRIQNGVLHFFVYFRSWDLWGGFPANLAAIEMLKQYMATEIGVESGEIVAASKGLHLYDYSFDLAKLLRMKEDIVLKEGEVNDKV